jgi:hypothetical protein
MGINKKNKTIADWIAIGENILTADNEAIANIETWQLVPAMRAEIEAKYSAFADSTTKADTSGTAYTESVKRKRRLAKEGKKATAKLAVYIENAFLDEARRINHRLLLDIAYPNDDEVLSQHLVSICSALGAHDQTTYPLPADFVDPVYAVKDEFCRALIDVRDFFEDRCTATQERNRKLAEFRILLKPIRMWLYRMLPQGRYDTRLIGYGFTPYNRRRKRRAK